jgi:uncharacterized protein (DUF433 family)
MSELITESVKGEPYQYYPLGEHVVRAVGVCGGRPTFKYTRIEIAGTLDRLAVGESLDAIVAGYRGRVSREAVIEAIQVERHLPADGVVHSQVDALPDIKDVAAAFVTG